VERGRRAKAGSVMDEALRFEHAADEADVGLHDVHAALEQRVEPVDAAQAFAAGDGGLGAPRELGVTLEVAVRQRLLVEAKAERLERGGEGDGVDHRDRVGHAALVAVDREVHVGANFRSHELERLHEPPDALRVGQVDVLEPPLPAGGFRGVPLV
jgi:hypothetical protein